MYEIDCKVQASGTI